MKDQLNLRVFSKNILRVCLEFCNFCKAPIWKWGGEGSSSIQVVLKNMETKLSHDKLGRQGYLGVTCIR